ncbi:DUF3888 domain-containing protein [Clostridium lundense]|uniref:DUF3888 domain-containing protein n=1 Tax=Clostridium lundense TaxID=319475 RepID=UPI000488255C|nr:DUF3888 domain-containing protein [Clostridium lundense]
MKRILNILLVVILLIQYPNYIFAFGVPKEIKNNDSVAPFLTEDVNRIYIVNMLSGYTTKEIKDHYGMNLPWQLEDGKIIDAKMIYGQEGLIFIFKLQVQPFVGAHNPIGTDNFTFKVLNNKIILEKYEHVESFPIPPYLKQYYKNLKQNY